MNHGTHTLIKVTGTASDGEYMIQAEGCAINDQTCFQRQQIDNNGWIIYWLPYLIGVVVFVGVFPLLALAAYNLYYNPRIYKLTFTKKVKTEYNVDF